VVFLTFIPKASELVILSAAGAKNLFFCRMSPMGVLLVDSGK